ncbi:MAG: hypothetical protein WC910_07135 [Bacteroidales bacterium]|jgi:hypothetical protein
MNRLYSVLADNMNLSSELHYYRKAGTAHAKWPDKNLLRTLVPLGEAEYTAFCIEQLVQVVRHSEYKDMLAAWDTDNTYSTEIPRISAEQSVTIPTGKTLRIIKRGVSKTIYTDAAISVDGSSVTTSVNGVTLTQAITWLGGVSSVFSINQYLDGSFIDSDMADTGFTAALKFTTPPERNLVSLAAGLKKHIQTLPTAYTELLFPDRPFEVIAAVVLANAEAADNG